MWERAERMAILPLFRNDSITARELCTSRIVAPGRTRRKNTWGWSRNENKTRNRMTYFIHGGYGEGSSRQDIHLHEPTRPESHTRRL